MVSYCGPSTPFCGTQVGMLTGVAEGRRSRWTELEKAVTLAQGEAGRSRDDLIEERRAAIISAAEKLLAVHGFDALRLRDVSKEAGVSIGLIQHYFTTRDELLYETMRVASERRAEQWSRLGSGQESAR